MGMQPAARPTAMEMMIWKNFMTMPCTAMGICAYWAWENTGSSAPYLRSMLLTAAIDATMDICERKLHIPSGRKRPISLPLSTKLLLCSLTAFIRQRYQMESAAVSTWPSTVATAAPIMPHLKPKMKSGSSIMLTTAPETVAAMAKRGLPSERIIGFMAWPNM